MAYILLSLTRAVFLCLALFEGGACITVVLAAASTTAVENPDCSRPVGDYQGVRSAGLIVEIQATDSTPGEPTEGYNEAPSERYGVGPWQIADSFVQWLSTHDTYLEAAGYLGMLGGWSLSLAPLPTIYDIAFGLGHVGGYKPDLFLVTLLQSLLWVIYGLTTPDRALLVQANGVNCVIMLFYIVVYAVWMHTAEIRWYFLKVSSLCTGILFCGIILGVGCGASGALGVVAILVNIVMYGSPLSVLSTVIATRSVRFMPLLPSWGALFCSTAWLVWAILAHDTFVVIPNVLGVCLGVAQLLVYYHYRQIERRYLLEDVSAQLATETISETSTGEVTGNRPLALLPVSPAVQ